MTSRFVLVSITLLVAFCAYFIKYGEIYFSIKSDVYPLVIGILSSRENFAARQIIRRTWLNISQTLKGHSYKSFFIVGNKGCNIPSQCRINKYDCEELFVNLAELKEYFYSSTRINNKQSSSELYEFHPGISFQVNHPVVIMKLGLPKELLIPNKPVSISLKDIQTKDVIVKTSIILTNETEISDNGFVYKEVENFFLPTGYEGLLVVEGYLYHASYLLSQWNNGSGAITFKRIYVSQNHHDSLEFSNNSNVAPVAAFKVIDIDRFKNKTLECNQILLERKRDMKEETEKLIQENRKWNDIVFVDVVDVYRNLPRKLLLFYKWLTAHIDFNAVLKTDDDCIIDIAAVLLKLNKDEKFLPWKRWIWSRFRYGWLLNLVGKWSDYEYKAPVYPMFPCGGGYAMSRTVVQWLSDNANHLYPYQGEDVSIGIWLAAINAQFIQDLNWECDSECTESSYNRVQLNSNEMINFWSIKNKCQNICHCK